MVLFWGVFCLGYSAVELPCGLDYFSLDVGRWVAWVVGFQGILAGFSDLCFVFWL